MRDPDLYTLFHPRSVAMIGVSKTSSTKISRFGRGTGLIGILRKVGFPGKVYPVHPSINEIMGMKAYKSLNEVPDSIDLAIISVANYQVPKVLNECITAGIKNVQIFSAGFSETGEKEGRDLERKIIEIARKGRINLIGPNCVGFHLPYVRFSTISTFLDESGPVAFLTQSGGHAINFIGNSHFNGIRLSKVISYGNGVILDSADYLEYLSKDPETKIIALYIEGIREGRKFYQVVKGANKNKPIIVWKGGVTESGAKAAASHTGSLSGESEIWQALIKQTGVVTVDSMQELLDMIRTFLLPESLYEKRIGLLISGGGQSVVAADYVAHEGLDLPVFSKQKQEIIYSFISRINTSSKNPVDIGLGGLDLRTYEQIINAMVNDPQIDLLIIDPQIEMIHEPDPQYLDKIADLFCHFTNYKPLVVILDTWEGNLLTLGQIQRIKKTLTKAGVVTYSNLSRACRAIGKFLNYQRWLLFDNCNSL